MEFEKAIFRVYEKSIEGLVNDEEQRNDAGDTSVFSSFKNPCRIFELLTFSLGCFFLFCLILLHSSYVGNTGCLPAALTVYNTTTKQSSIPQYSKDTILLINIDPVYMKDKGFGGSTSLDDDLTDDYSKKDSSSSHQHNSLVSMSLSSISNSFFNNNQRPTCYTPFECYEAKNSISTLFTSGLSKFFNLYSLESDLLPQKQNLRNLLKSVAPFNSNSTSSSNTSNDHSIYYQTFDYVLTFDWAVTILDNDILAKYRFEVVNITLDGYGCFGSSTAEAFLPLGGLDHAVLNNIIYTLKQDGYLFTRYGDLYHWTMNEFSPYSTGFQWMSYKFNVLWSSLLSYFLLSTTTALLVRVLISSGVVFIFPLFWLFRSIGLQGISMRIIAISYPWIGIPLQLIQHRNQSVWPFLIAHSLRVIIYYLLYIAAQSVYLKWLYYGTTFNQGILWLYAVMMIWEYFSLIYIRALGSIVLFPRASLAFFLIFHFYYYSFPAGFHVLALLCIFVFMMALMAYCVRVYEVKAYRQGLVNVDQPRLVKLFSALCISHCSSVI
jgi:hypothetical protein